MISVGVERVPRRFVYRCPSKQRSLNHGAPHFIIFVLALFSAATALADTQGTVDQAIPVHNILRQSREAAAGGPEDCTLLREIATAQAKAGDIDGAIQTASGIKDDWCSRLAFENLDAVFGQVQNALKITDQIRDDRAKAYALLAIVKSQADVGHLDIAARAAAGIPHSRMRKTEWKTEAMAMIARVRSRTIASAQAKTGDIVNAIRTVKQAPFGRESDAEYSSLVVQLIGVNDLKGAVRLITEMRDESARDSAWQEIARAQAKAGEVRAALQTVTNCIRDASRKAQALSAIAMTQATAGDKTGAREIFGKALQAAASVQPPDDKSESFGEIAVAQAEAGDIAGALATTHAIGHEAIERQTLHAIAEIRAKMGDIPGAIETAGLIPYASLRDASLVTIALTQYQTGDMHGAMDTIAGIQLNDLKAAGLSQIAQAQAKAGDRVGVAKTVEQTFRVIASIQPDSVRGNTIMCSVGPIARTQVRSGDRDGALRTLEQALQVAAAIPPTVVQKAWTLDMIGSAQRFAGDRAGAIQTFQQAREAAALLASSLRSNGAVLRSISMGQAKAGDIQGALQTFAMTGSLTSSEMTEEGGLGPVLQAIARAQAKSGDQHGAYALAESQISPLLKANTLLGLAEGTLERMNTAHSQTALLAR
jgi:tetratricopeptide (TPR) repeat protein